MAQVEEHIKEAELAKHDNGQNIRLTITKYIIEEGHILEKLNMLKEVKHNKPDSYGSFFHKQVTPRVPTEHITITPILLTSN